MVPLNALLQERGKHSVGAGNAIAVQNLGENTAMLFMLGLYSLVVKLGAPVVAVGVGLVWYSRWLLLCYGAGSGGNSARKRVSLNDMICLSSERISRRSFRLLTNIAF